MRTTRIIKRNMARALKARGPREKAQAQAAFTKGVTLGADLQKAKIHNATAGYQYEEEPNAPVSNREDGSLPADDSESALGGAVGDLPTEPHFADTSRFYDSPDADAIPA